MGLAFSALYLGRPVPQGWGSVRLLTECPTFVVRGLPFFPADPFGVHHEPPSQLLAWGGVGLREPLKLILDCRLFDLGSGGGGWAGFAGIRVSRCSEPGEGRRLGRGARVQASRYLPPVPHGTRGPGGCPSSWRRPHIAPVGLALASCPFTRNLLSLPSVAGQMGTRERRSRRAVRWELLTRKEKEGAWREMEARQPEPPVAGN